MSGVEQAQADAASAATSATTVANSATSVAPQHAALDQTPPTPASSSAAAAPTTTSIATATSTPPDAAKLAELEAAKYCVRLRGFNRGVTEADVRQFLSGVEVMDVGIPAAHSATGREDIIVSLRAPQDIVRAHKKHRTYIGSRYVEVMPADAKDMATARRPLTAEEAAMDCARITNVSYQCLTSDIVAFVHRETGSQVLDVVVALNKNSQPTGEVFVQLESPDVAALLATKDRTELKGRAVRICQTSRISLTVMKMHVAHLKEPTGPMPHTNTSMVMLLRDVGFNTSEEDILKILSEYSIAPQRIYVHRDAEGKSKAEVFIIFGTSEEYATAFGIPALTKLRPDARVEPSTKVAALHTVGQLAMARADSHMRDMVRIRGIPFSFSPEDVLKHFPGHTGDAIIQFASPDVAKQVIEAFKNLQMGGRWIMLFLATRGELYSALCPPAFGHNMPRSVYMRGLPASWFEVDVAKFFAPLIPRSTTMTTARGQSPGSAVVCFDTVDLFVNAMCRNKARAGDRAVDLLPLLDTEVADAKAGVIPSRIMPPVSSRMNAANGGAGAGAGGSAAGSGAGSGGASASRVKRSPSRSMSPSRRQSVRTRSRSPVRDRDRTSGRRGSPSPVRYRSPPRGRGSPRARSPLRTRSPPRTRSPVRAPSPGRNRGRSRSRSRSWDRSRGVGDYSREGRGLASSRNDRGTSRRDDSRDVDRDRRSSAYARADDYARSRSRSPARHQSRSNGSEYRRDAADRDAPPRPADDWSRPVAAPGNSSVSAYEVVHTASGPMSVSVGSTYAPATRDAWVQPASAMPPAGWMMQQQPQQTVVYAMPSAAVQPSASAPGVQYPSDAFRDRPPPMPVQYLAPAGTLPSQPVPGPVQYAYAVPGPMQYAPAGGHVFYADPSAPMQYYQPLSQYAMPAAATTMNHAGAPPQAPAAGLPPQYTQPR